MRQAVLKQASKYAKAHQRRRRWHKAVSCLAAVVVFCTTYALILPAITLEQDKCDIPEHVHDESCYELVGGHIHTDECYTAQRGELICTKEERPGHIHTDACYTARQGELICTEEERPGHQHTDACYTEYTQLICDLPEGEDHQHTDECYETVRELTCGLEEDPGHQHTDECYETILELTCGLEEDPGHEHTDACYAWEPVLTCGKEEFEGGYVLTCGPEEGEIVTTVSDTPVCGLEEHTHTLACYADPTADVETAQIWERSLKSVELTGIWREDVIAVAKTQLGYQESAKNYIVLEDGETLRGYTRYGAWYGDPYGDWCAMFASFVLNYAEVEGIPLDANCQHWIETLSEEEHDLYRPADEYLPQPGDLIFFDFDIEDEEPTADHVGLVAEIINDEDGNPAQLKTIEGNSSDKVQYVTYELDDPAILGYGQLPEQEPEDEEPIEEPAEQFVLTAESEDGIAVTVSGDPESLPYPVEEITLSVQPVTDEDTIALWNQTLEEAGENAEEAFLLDIALLHDGEEIEPTGPVQVTFEGVETGENDDLTVFHVDAENEETEDMNAVVDEEGAVVLDTDHFSVYGGLVSVSGQTQKPGAGDYIYLDLTAVGGWSNGGWKLGFLYNNDQRIEITNYPKVSDTIYKIQLPLSLDNTANINFFRYRNETDIYSIPENAQGWISGNRTFEAGTNLFKMTGYASGAGWTGQWDSGNWYVESLAGQNMAFENKSGTDLTGVKACFYASTSNSPVATVDVATGTIADGTYATFQIPTDYGSYVQFIAADGTILGDKFSNFLGEGVGESNVESFVYNNQSKYCYKYKNDASDSTWGVPGDGVEIHNETELKAFLEGDGAVGKLANNFNCSTAITVKGDKTLNLNSKTISSSVASLFTVGSGATLTITDNVDVTEKTPEEQDESVAKYGHDGTLDGYKLTYYVTESTVETNGYETKETVYKHEVDFTNAGKIVSSSTGDNVIKVEGGTLNLEGGVISSNGSHAVVLSTSKSGTMNMSGGLIKGKDGCGTNGAGVYMGSGNLNMSGGYIAGGSTATTGEYTNGGGIYMNDGTINLTDDAVIAANHANNGGGIYVNSGVLNIDGGVISGNYTNDSDNGGYEIADGTCGGGVYVNTGTISMTGGYVTNNSKKGGAIHGGVHGGGGIFYHNASMFMSGGYVTGNYSKEAGGGIYAGHWRSTSPTFVMSGGTIAQNVADLGEGGGIRIAQNTEAVISAPAGNAAYITNNTTNTTDDWGGGGIFVQTSGTYGSLNILDVLITKNTAGGFGGGVASCPSGGVDGVANRGAAIFDNSASCTNVRPENSDKDFDWRYKDNYSNYGHNNHQFTSNDARDYFTTGDVSTMIQNQGMIGGGMENWTSSGRTTTDDPQVEAWGIPKRPADHLPDDYEIKVYALTANPTDEAKEAAINAATVFVTGNHSNTHGGGITTNGKLDMGKTDKKVNKTTLTINATKQIMLASGSLQTTDLPPFEFVLLSKKPTWDADAKQFTFAQSDIVDTATNDTSGNIQFSKITYDVASYYTYYLVEKPITTQKPTVGSYEQDATLYTIGVMVDSNTVVDTDTNTKTTTYSIQKVELKLEKNGVAIGSKAGNLVDLADTQEDDGTITTNKSITLTDLNGKTTFNNRQIVSYELPSTGSTGTTLYTTGGLLLMVSASALLLYNHQKRRKEAHASS